MLQQLVQGDVAVERPAEQCLDRRRLKQLVGRAGVHPVVAISSTCSAARNFSSVMRAPRRRPGSPTERSPRETSALELGEPSSEASPHAHHRPLMARRGGRRRSSCDVVQRAAVEGPHVGHVRIVADVLADQHGAGERVALQLSGEPVLGRIDESSRPVAEIARLWLSYCTNVLLVPSYWSLQPMIATIPVASKALESNPHDGRTVASPSSPARSSYRPRQWPAGSRPEARSGCDWPSRRTAALVELGSQVTSVSRPHGDS